MGKQFIVCELLLLIQTVSVSCTISTKKAVYVRRKHFHEDIVKHFSVSSFPLWFPPCCDEEHCLRDTFCVKTCYCRRIGLLRYFSCIATGFWFFTHLLICALHFCLHRVRLREALTWVYAISGNGVPCFLLRVVYYISFDIPHIGGHWNGGG